MNALKPPLSNKVHVITLPTLHSTATTLSNALYVCKAFSLTDARSPQTSGAPARAIGTPAAAAQGHEAAVHLPGPGESRQLHQGRLKAT